MLLLGLLQLSARAHGAGALTLSKGSFKVSYVQSGEKMHRLRASLSRDEPAPTGAQFNARREDTMSVQLQYEMADGKAGFPEQALLRVYNARLQADNLFLVRRKGRELRADVWLAAESRTDEGFWQKGDALRVEVVVGGEGLEGWTWKIGEMRLVGDWGFEKKRDVFDFDVGVKKGLLDEFDAPVREEEKRAGGMLVGGAIVGVLGAFVGLIVGWGNMGVLPLKKGGDIGIGWGIGFQGCLLSQIIVLGLFWVRWDIVTTWKVMGMIMIPTIVCGRRVLG